MCATCGCSSGGGARLMTVGGGHSHSHPHGAAHHNGRHHDHDHEHDHEHELDHEHDREFAQVEVLSSADSERTVELQQKALAKNDQLAAVNRECLRGRGILAVNLMSSPGAGKTTLLERTARDLSDRIAISVVEGDQETALDASRMLRAGSKVVQINTGAGCHLDAEMLSRALRSLDPAAGSIVMIENVDNLVCPALFDLGEQARGVLGSTPEGAEKPLKYPHMFRQADLVLLNKIDLLPYTDFDVREDRKST